MSGPRQPDLDFLPENDPPGAAAANDDAVGRNPAELSRPQEIGGRPGPEPTRYGDWEKNGRCIDF